MWNQRIFPESSFMRQSGEIMEQLTPYQRGRIHERNLGRIEKFADNAPSVEVRRFQRFRGSFRYYATRHRAKVANALSGVRSGLRVNSNTERCFNWT